MAKPILDAVKLLMPNGTYKSILAKWGAPGRRNLEPDDQRRNQLI